MTDNPHRFATDCIHAGQSPDPTTGAIMTPVYMTSTYVQSSPGIFKDGYDYSRSNTLTLPPRERRTHGLRVPSGLGSKDSIPHLLMPRDPVRFATDCIHAGQSPDP